MFQTIIIGAGIAGVSAAINLVKAGKRVLVLDQNPNPGGRVYSFTDKITGEIIDNGQHLMTGAYSNFLRITDELGTSQHLTIQKHLKIEFVSENGIIGILDCSLLPGKAGILLGLMRMKNLSSQSKYSVAKLFLKIRTIDLSNNDMTVEQFLTKEQQTKNSIINFWEPLTFATLNNSIRKSSAKLLITVLKKAFFSGKDNSKLIFPNSPLSDLLSPFQKWLEEHDSKAIFKAKILDVIIENNKIISVKTAKNEYKAKNFIFAIPPNNLFNLLNDNHKILAEKFSNSNIQYSPIVSVYLWLDKAFPEIKFAAMLGTRSQWVFNRKKILKDLSYNSKTYKSKLTITISNAADIMHYPKSKISELCLAELKKLFPTIKGANLVHSIVVKMKYATVLQTPESIKLLPKTTTSIKNMYLAGDYINTGLPATIEGAASSGKIASAYLI